MKFYCEYCKSYLTHDKMSVRKSHLQGKNHIKLYCNYYEQVLKQQGIYEDKVIDVEYINRYAPGSNYLEGGGKDDDEMDLKLPPPPTVMGLPAPPPSVLNNDRDKELVVYHQMN